MPLPGLVRLPDGSLSGGEGFGAAVQVLQMLPGGLLQEPPQQPQPQLHPQATQNGLLRK